MRNAIVISIAVHALLLAALGIRGAEREMTAPGVGTVAVWERVDQESHAAEVTEPVELPPGPEPMPVPAPAPETQPAIAPVPPSDQKPPPADVPELQPSTPMPQGATEPLDSTECDRAPVLVRASWPRTVRRLFRGTVLARAIVAADGTPRAVQIIEGTGNARWDADILRALQFARFEPAVKDGSPVECAHKWRITFRDE